MSTKDRVSSPIEKRYPIGTELELISRSDGWAQVRNPISKHTGWVLEQHYLAPAKSTSSQLATVEPEDQVTPSTKPRRKRLLRTKGFASLTRTSRQRFFIWLGSKKAALERPVAKQTAKPTQLAPRAGVPLRSSLG